MAEPVQVHEGLILPRDVFVVVALMHYQATEKQHDAHGQPYLQGSMCVCTHLSVCMHVCIHAGMRVSGLCHCVTPVDVCLCYC